MKDKTLLLLILGGVAAYVLYQRTAQAGVQSEAAKKQYLEDLRAAALRQQQSEAARNRAGVVEVGLPTVSPAPAFVPKSTKFGPVMDPR